MTTLKSPKPDANGWTKGGPTEEGAYWYCVKDKHGKWRLYFGDTDVIAGTAVSNVKGWGFARPEELVDAYHKPAELPELPTAVIRALKRTASKQ
jgi:hypothetical protein